MHEFRVWIGQRYVGTVRADNYEQAVDRARVKYRMGPYARVRVSRVDEI
ncbi:hypothetical protein KB681_gp41 [Burkholderia phage Mica]|uniref:Uncharacterized protein n=1 Tax=Burkholderia phage Mica TaxID=2767579 RepID=A0A873WLX2_9CAUD|nr:hypothetical protein KB681_gp41 [Burkholderia phage Mica]QPB08671.1 hypothetical protein CPT_Mica_059 [Burkholderia phage Mica]